MNNESRSSPRKGLLIGVLYFFTVAVVVAGLMWVLPSSDDDSGPATADQQATPTTIQPDTTSTTSDAVEVEAPSFVGSEEPIADAAEIILPSVVHIQTENGLGSGVVYDSDGLIVTAAHVVEGQETVLVRFDNGEQTQGTVLGAEIGVDIAVIQVDRQGLPAAVFQTEKPRVGQLAIAVGSPWGLESTVTAGIISAVDQANCDFGACFSQIQTDAAINPGNSGGALVNRQGEVVGINVSIRTQSGANDGVGFAVPSETIVEYAESIITGEQIETAFLGVRGAPSDGDRAGALIIEVTPGTAAEEAGLQVDDVVIGIDDINVQGIDDLAAQIRTHRPGDIVELTVIRDGEQSVLEVTLGAFPDDAS